MLGMWPGEEDDSGRETLGSARFWIFLAFLLLCLLGGGGSRDDIVSLLYLRPAAVICAALMVALPGRIELRLVRFPLLLLVALAVWMALQLVPLPPSIWQELPGRAPLREAAVIAAVQQPWRPISISPDLTMNSLAALVVPIATLLGFAALRERQRYALLPVLIGAVLLSAVLGIAQLSGGALSSLRFYDITNSDSAVGFFANRNHQAAFLVLGFPLLSLWAAGGSARRGPTWRPVIAAAMALFLVPMILVTGSRAGLAFGAIALIWSALNYLLAIRTRRRGRRLPWRALLIGLAGLIVINILFFVLASGRMEAVQRLLSADVRADERYERLPTLVGLARDYLPWGSGFGTFDPLYRMHEPFESLFPFYLNHAHNDLLELIITGGLPALALLFGTIVWLGWRAWRSYIRPGGEGHAYARLGLTMLVLLLGWSLVDYPLRTPSIAALAAIAAGWTLVRDAATWTSSSQRS